MGTINRKIELLEIEYEKQYKLLNSHKAELDRKLYESSIWLEKQRSHKNSLEKNSDENMRLSEMKDHERKKEILQEISTLQADIQVSFE